MDLERLRSAQMGELVPISGLDADHGPFDYFAFVPIDLPDDIPPLRSETLTAVVNAERALSRLGQACQRLGEPSLLVRPALWRESLQTSAIEGTHGTLEALLEADLPNHRFVTPETAEIRAYERVALAAHQDIEHRPITVGLLSAYQRELFREAPDPPQDLGGVRTHQVFIGPKGRPITDARYVPPPPDDRLSVGLERWEQWLSLPMDHLPGVVRAALAHYQFESLHPFGDGNGRLGRLVIVLQLLREGWLDFPALSVSPWLYTHREAYHRQLFEVSATGTWDDWIRFFAHAVCAQSESSIAGANALLAWREGAVREVRSRGWGGAAIDIIDGFLEWPLSTVAEVATRHGVSQMTAARAIKRLVEADVLSNLDDRKYGRVFAARQVMDIVEEI